MNFTYNFVCMTMKLSERFILLNIISDLYDAWMFVSFLDISKCINFVLLYLKEVWFYSLLKVIENYYFLSIRRRKNTLFFYRK